jgi:myb proto-oncogene protein
MDSNVPREWNAQEDALLASAVATYGARKWKDVAEEVMTRNSTQCQQRWTKALRPGLNKGHWSGQEDALLLRLVGEFGTDWPKVAENWAGTCTPGASCRTIKQIRERWTNKLNPTISRSPWSAEEDRRIVELHNKLGNSWSNIARHLPGRVGEGVKTRYKTLFRRAQKAMEERTEGGIAKKQKTHPNQQVSPVDEVQRRLAPAVEAPPRTLKTEPKQGSAAVTRRVRSTRSARSSIDSRIFCTDAETVHVTDTNGETWHAPLFVPQVDRGFLTGPPAHDIPIPNFQPPAVALATRKGKKGRGEEVVHSFAPVLSEAKHVMDVALDRAIDAALANKSMMGAIRQQLYELVLTDTAPLQKHKMAMMDEIEVRQAAVTAIIAEFDRSMSYPQHIRNSVFPAVEQGANVSHGNIPALLRESSSSSSINSSINSSSSSSPSVSRSSSSRSISSNRAAWGPPAHMVEDTFAASHRPQHHFAIALQPGALPAGTNGEMAPAVSHGASRQDLADDGSTPLSSARISEDGEGAMELFSFLQEYFPEVSQTAAHTAVNANLPIQAAAVSGGQQDSGAPVLMADLHEEGPQLMPACAAPWRSSSQRSTLLRDSTDSERTADDEMALKAAPRRVAMVTSSLKSAVKSALKKAAKLSILWPKRSPRVGRTYVLNEGGSPAVMKRDASCPAKLCLAELSLEDTPNTIARKASISTKW